MTLFLTGCGDYYRKYLYNFGLGGLPNYPCNFDKFTREKRSLNEAWKVNMNLPRVIGEMLNSKENWLAASTETEKIQNKLLKEANK